MGKKKLAVTVAPSALVHPTAKIGAGTKIWAFVQVGEHAQIGSKCILGNGVYIDRHVRIGNRVWIQNKALLYHGVTIADDAFIGPGVCFTNDPTPRSGVRRNLGKQQWQVGRGASIGANATILPNVSIGQYALVGAGAVVTKNVPSHALVCGNPAKVVGLVCICGVPIKHFYETIKVGLKKPLTCQHCSRRLAISQKQVQLICSQ